MLIKRHATNGSENTKRVTVVIVTTCFIDPLRVRDFVVIRKTDIVVFMTHHMYKAVTLPLLFINCHLFICLHASLATTFHFVMLSSIALNYLFY